MGLDPPPFGPLPPDERALSNKQKQCPDGREEHECGDKVQGRLHAEDSRNTEKSALAPQQEQTICRPRGTNLEYKAIQRLKVRG